MAPSTFGLLLAFIDMATIVPVASFIAIAVAAWAAMDWLSANKEKGKRLDILSSHANGRSYQKMSTLDSAKGVVAELLQKNAPRFATHLEPKTVKDKSKLKQRMLEAGFRTSEAQAVFLGSKVLLLLIGCVLGGIIFLFVNGFSTFTLIRTLIFGGVFFFIPEVYLTLRIKKRKEDIFLGLPDVLDLLVVCVEAGLGLDQAMRKVQEEMKKSRPIISEEFSVSNMQVQMGRSRSDVLLELGTRTGVEDLKSLAIIIVQAEKFGSSVAQALRVQSDSMRTRRKQIAEEKAAKTAVKLIFPLVLFIFPALFVVLVGPAGIQMSKEFARMNATPPQSIE